MTSRDLEMRMSLLESVLKLRFLRQEGALERAIREIYFTRAANSIIECARAILPLEAVPLLEPWKPGTLAGTGEDRHGLHCGLFGRSMAESTGAVQDDTKVAEQVGFEISRRLLQTRSLSEVRTKLPPPHAVRSAAAELGAAVVARDPIRAAEALEKMGILAVSRAPEQHFGGLEFSVAAVTGRRRLILIVELAVIAAEMGILQRARAYLAESQTASPGPLEAHDLHTVAGLLALNDGDLARASEELFASVYVCRGIGNLVARGPLPNFTLAKRLLEAGEKTPVVAYLRRCQQRWNNCADAIGQWIDSIQEGLKPAAEPELFTETNSWTLTLKMQALSANSVGSMGRTAFSSDEMNEARAQRQRDSAAAVRGKLGMSRS